MAIFEGSCVALVTPFTQTGVDYESLSRLIDFQIKGGTDCLLILGTTGEPATMTAEEKKEVIRFSIEVINHRVPVMIGTGCNSTQSTIESSKMAEELGADMLLVVTPYYNKCTQKGLVTHYHTVADSVHTPIMVYNVPSRTNVNIQPATMAEISKHKNIVALKAASGNLSQIMETARLTRGNLDIYSGNDGDIIPIMSIGGKGVVSVMANIIPRETHNIVADYLAGRQEQALESQLKLYPLIHALFCEVNPIPVKTAVNLIGQQAGPLRLPLTEMEPANLERLKNEMKAIGLL